MATEPTNKPSGVKKPYKKRVKSQAVSAELVDGTVVSPASIRAELNKGKEGRPYTILDEEQITKLAEMGASIGTIANFFDCDPNTILYSYSHAYTKGRENLNLRLQVTQVNTALNGSVPMLIHLGKTRLGQKDSVEISVETPPNPMVEHIPDDKLMTYLFEVTANDPKAD